MKSKVELHKVRDIPVHLIRLAQQRVEVLVSELDTDLREELCEAGTKASYVQGEPEHTDQGTLIYHLPTKHASFKELIDRLVNLIASCIEQHKERSNKAHAKIGRKSKGRGSSINTQIKASRKPKARKIRSKEQSSKGYHYRALTT